MYLKCQVLTGLGSTFDKECFNTPHSNCWTIWSHLKSLNRFNSCQTETQTPMCSTRSVAYNLYNTSRIQMKLHWRGMPWYDVCLKIYELCCQQIRKSFEACQPTNTCSTPAATGDCEDWVWECSLIATPKLSWSLSNCLRQKQRPSTITTRKLSMMLSIFEPDNFSKELDVNHLDLKLQHVCHCVRGHKQPHTESHKNEAWNETPCRGGV